MFIPRDLTHQLTQPSAWIQMLLGPRQCGKSTLFASLLTDTEVRPFHEINFDDLQLREFATRDPALFMHQFQPPLLLDEIQYVPPLFSELKKIIDQYKRKAALGSTALSKPEVLFRLTGSNQILMDKNIKESLAGRASFYYLNTLTVHEILQALPETKLNQILFQGGWPELYTHPDIPVTSYLNDYIRTYVEKDIVMSAGIQKVSEFLRVLGLLAGRTGLLTNYSAIASDSGMSSITIKEWVGFLERADLVYLLRPYHTNLNKRLIKTPKLYFLDTGLAARLQGWSDPLVLFTSPQVGPLFETLVFAEIFKFIRNYQKDWQLFFWRTKDGQEVDFVLKTASHKIYLFEAKLSMPRTPVLPDTEALKKDFPNQTQRIIVTSAGQRLQIAKEQWVIPITELHHYLSTIEC